MAQFLKIGDLHINVALISGVEMTADTVTISVMSADDKQSFTFHGEETVSLFSDWIKRNTEDLGVAPEKLKNSALHAFKHD